MHRPNVGAEWSSDTTTVSPFASFFMLVGAFHCCPVAGRVMQPASSRHSHKRLTVELMCTPPNASRVTILTVAACGDSGCARLLTSRFLLGLAQPGISF